MRSFIYKHGNNYFFKRMTVSKKNLLRITKWSIYLSYLYLKHSLEIIFQVLKFICFLIKYFKHLEKRFINTNATTQFYHIQTLCNLCKKSIRSHYKLKPPCIPPTYHSPLPSLEGTTIQNLVFLSFSWQFLNYYCYICIHKPYTALFA